jgi:four helix bundle protein
MPKSSSGPDGEEGADKTRRYDLETRLINLAILISEIVDRLPNTRLGVHVGGQLIRSGTSPAPNYAEAQAAESRADFIHKLKVVVKELRESRVWLIMVDRKGMIRESGVVASALAEANELIAIFVKSIGTARKNMVAEDRKGVPRVA